MAFAFPRRNRDFIRPFRGLKNSCSQQLSHPKLPTYSNASSLRPNLACFAPTSFPLLSHSPDLTITRHNIIEHEVRGSLPTPARTSVHTRPVMALFSRSFFLIIWFLVVDLVAVVIDLEPQDRRTAQLRFRTLSTSLITSTGFDMYCSPPDSHPPPPQSGSRLKCCCANETL